MITAKNTVYHNNKAVSELLEMVYQHKGWDFRNYKRTSISRRISRRLNTHNISSYKDYSDILRKDPAEYEKLLSTVTIKVSEFFREPDVFDLLKETITSELSDTRELKAWCCGCAYGEEAYSLGILLNECMEHKNLQNTKIFATDIDDNALNIARDGTYKEEFIKNVSSPLREKYFIKVDKGYRIKYSIRNMVRFGRLDIVTNAPLSKVDILFCRNLLIYFDNDLQETVFKKLNFALKPGGILVLGKAERPPSLFLPLYREIGKRSRIYRKEQL